jgi:hypothetical protein
VEPMTFASGPVLASGGQIDSAMNPSTTVTRITFDYTLGSGDAQIGAGKGKDRSEEYSVA